MQEQVVASFKLRVRYAETDRMGYVYHGNYAQYYEVARVEMLRELGVDYKKLEDDGVLLPVRELRIKYLAPAYYDENLTIRTRISAFTPATIQFEYEMVNEREEVISSASTTLVFVSAENRKPMRAPAHIVQLLEASSA